MEQRHASCRPSFLPAQRLQTEIWPHRALNPVIRCRQSKEKVSVTITTVELAEGFACPGAKSAPNVEAGDSLDRTAGEGATTDRLCEGSLSSGCEDGTKIELVSLLGNKPTEE